jgi:hypothetical protein
LAADAVIAGLRIFQKCEVFAATVELPTTIKPFAAASEPT